MARKAVLGIWVIFLVAGWSLPVQAQNDPEEMKVFFVAEFNRILREDFNALPLAHNPILEDVAQDIADEIGCRDDEVQFDIQGDVTRLGYKSYPGFSIGRTTRVPLVTIVNNRPLDTLMRNYTNIIFTSNINRSGLFYREIGVGVSICQNTRTPQYSLFVVLGAQPDVIPVVIENGAPTLEADSAPVTVTLSVHEENSRRAPGIFGKASTMRFSTLPLDERIPVLDYAPSAEIELTACGTNTVFYELIDTEGVTVTGETSVEVICAEGAPAATEEAGS